MGKVNSDQLIPLLKEGDVVTRYEFYYVVYRKDNGELNLRSLLNPAWEYNLRFLHGDSFRIVTDYEQIDCRSKWQREQAAEAKRAATEAGKYSGP